MQVRNSSNPRRLGCSRDRSLPPKARLGVSGPVVAPKSAAAGLAERLTVCMFFAFALGTVF